MILEIDTTNKDKENQVDETIINRHRVAENRNQTVVKPPKKKRPIRKILLLTLLLFLLAGAGFLIWKGYIITKNIGFKLNSVSLVQNKEPELKKDSEGKHTNILLVGIDTRDKGELLNTDTIILLSYSYETNNTVMLSIPRDFHVEVSKETKWFARINSVYSTAEGKKEGSGLEALKKSVEEVTGKEIQYYGMIDYKAFLEIIDTVGGINVNVENNFTDYMYPSDRGVGYKTVRFLAGPQVMDGETALEYSRSRHSSQNNEGTDYARARRQQKVILALKEKISQNEVYTNPKTVTGIISSLSKNIKISEFTVQDIEAGIKLIKEFDKNGGKTYSFVLDPLSGGQQLVETKTLPSGAFAIGPKEGLGKYSNIREYINLIIQKPQLYSEKPTVYVYDIGLGYKEVVAQTEKMREEFKYIPIYFRSTLFKDKEGIYVYSETNGLTESKAVFSKFLGTEKVEKPDFIKTNLGRENVIILLGKPVQLNTEN